jgi:hypothetical protein
MARVKIHIPCRRPLNECDCPPDDDEPDGEPQDGGDEEDAP